MSSCASRSWIISGLPTRLARSMCQRKASCCACRRRVVPVVVEAGLADRDDPRRARPAPPVPPARRHRTRRCGSGAAATAAKTRGSQVDASAAHRAAARSSATVITWPTPADVRAVEHRGDVLAASSAPHASRCVCASTTGTGSGFRYRWPLPLAVRCHVTDRRPLGPGLAELRGRASRTAASASPAAGRPRSASDSHLACSPA